MRVIDLLCARCSAALPDLCIRLQELEEVLQRHLYLDGTGTLDRASLAAGGRIIPELTSSTYTFNTRRTPWYNPWIRRPSSSSHPLPLPEYAITPHTRLGECWPMDGRNGTLGLALQRAEPITAFTIDHIPFRMTPDPETAPRHGELWALIREPAVLTRVIASGLEVIKGSKLVKALDHYQDSTYKRSDFLRIGTFVFDVREGLPFRTFGVHEEVQRMELAFREMVLVVNDNWGSSSYTCLYRVRVHSEPGRKSVGGTGYDSHNYQRRP